MLHLLCVLCIILLLRCCCLIKYQLVVVHRYHDGKINDLLYMHPIVWCNAYISWYFCHYRYDFPSFSSWLLNWIWWFVSLHIISKIFSYIHEKHHKSWIFILLCWISVLLIFVSSCFYQKNSISLGHIYRIVQIRIIPYYPRFFLLSVNHASVFGMAYLWAFT